MTTSDKYVVRMTAALLEAYGVRDIVASPGSRVAPLIHAVAARYPEGEIHTVIDERQAAFQALGISLATGAPVALMCTSGSAMLNYAPALAEAYYRQIPLIAITADRPADVIDQDDSQTIRQPGALENIVKQTVDIDGEASDECRCCAVNRELNRALATAIEAPAGPVHINIHLDTPLSGAVAYDPVERFRKIEIVRPGMQFRFDCPGTFADKRILIVCGFMRPDERLSGVMKELSQRIPVVAEHVSNIVSGSYADIDAMLAMYGDDKGLVPDIVISTGGSIISRWLKEWLRGLPEDTQLWRVGRDRCIVDTYNRVERVYDMEPVKFFSALDEALLSDTPDTGYRDAWRNAGAACAGCVGRFISRAHWSQLKAMRMIFEGIEGQDTVLHLSNGMTVRYAALLSPRFRRIECNRGVSGIDGSTSTAVGDAIASPEHQVWLLTGDMSAVYDMSALLTPGLPTNLRVVVFSNGGGNIFRTIRSTRGLGICEQRLAVGPLEQLAMLESLPVLHAVDEQSLCEAIQTMKQSEGARILVVETDGEKDTEQFHELYQSLKSYLHE